MTLNQRLLSAKIEYHWWKIGAIRNKKSSASPKRKQKLSAAENFHRYKAEKASFEYEISAGLRDHQGFWI